MEYRIPRGTCDDLLAPLVFHCHITQISFAQIASNPSLQAIVITPCPSQVGASLFLSTARKHPQVLALIQAGMPKPLPAVSSRARRGPPVSASASSHVQGGPSGRVRANSTVMANSGAAFPAPTVSVSGLNGPAATSATAQNAHISHSNSNSSGTTKATGNSEPKATGKARAESSSTTACKSTSPHATPTAAQCSAPSASGLISASNEADHRVGPAQSEAMARKRARAARRISVA